MRNALICVPIGANVVAVRDAMLFLARSSATMATVRKERHGEPEFGDRAVSHAALAGLLPTALGSGVRAVFLSDDKWGRQEDR